MKRLLAILAVAMWVLSPVPSAVAADVASETVTATTLPVTDITSSSATFNGIRSFTGIHVLSPIPMATQGVNISALSVFRYGTSPNSLNNQVPAVYVTGQFDDTTLRHIFNAYVHDLLPCTTYYVQFCAVSPFPPGPPDAALGIGLDPVSVLLKGNMSADSDYYYGDIISFSTIGCPTLIGTGSHGSGGISGLVPTTPPTNLSNIVVQSAKITVTKVSPGDKVDVTASVTNKGGSNGTSKVSIYINGQEEYAQPITLTGGQSSPLHFYVSRNEPGTYSVYVSGVSAGTFTVDQFTPDTILIISGVLVALALVGSVIFFTRRRTLG